MELGFFASQSALAIEVKPLSLILASFSFCLWRVKKVICINISGNQAFPIYSFYVLTMGVLMIFCVVAQKSGS